MRRGEPVVIPQEKQQRAACSHIHAFSPPSGAKMNRGLTPYEDCSAVNSETSVTSSPLPACNDASVGKLVLEHTDTHYPLPARGCPLPAASLGPQSHPGTQATRVPLTKEPEEDLEPDAEPALAGIVVGVEDGVDDVKAGHPERHLERRPDLLMGHPHLLLRGPHRRHEPLPHRGWASRAGPRGAGPGAAARGGGLRGRLRPRPPSSPVSLAACPAARSRLPSWSRRRRLPGGL